MVAKTQRDDWMHWIRIRAACAVSLIWLTPSVCLAEARIHQPTGIAFPDEIAGFVRKGETNYEVKQPGLGASYAYVLPPGIVATVYVYSAGQCPVPSGIADTAVSRMREQTLAEIRQVYETVQEVAQDVVRLPGNEGEAQVFYNQLRVRKDGVPLVTRVWLWAARGHFVKIRLTVDLANDSFEKAQEFAAAMLRLADPGQDATPKSKETSPKKPPSRAVVQFDRSFMGKDGVRWDGEATAWLSYSFAIIAWATLCTVLDEAPPGPIQPSFAVERYARGIQIRTWRERLRGEYGPNAYFDAMVKVEEAGFLEMYLWRFHRRGAWGQLPEAIGGRKEEFDRWLAENLPGHLPQTRAGVFLNPKK